MRRIINMSRLEMIRELLKELKLYREYLLNLKGINELTNGQSEKK